jgi:hypothetical protein
MLDEARRKTEACYVLGYYSPDSGHDGKYRKVGLELTRPGLKAVKVEYFAESPQPQHVPQSACF